MLAITQPYSEPSAKAHFDADQVTALTRMGVLSADSAVHPAVAQWIRAVCRPRRWLELRWVSGSGAMLRGILARSGDTTVTALRSEHLMTCTELAVASPDALVPVLTAGLSGRAAARFDEFAMPAHIGAKADERLRRGESLDDVMDHLGIPASAHPVVRAAFAPGRSYVEIVAGDHRDGHRVTTDIGVSIVDTTAGRVVVAPVKAADGTWISTFTPGTDLAITAAVQRLTATLPDGPWFPTANLTRDFETSTGERKEHVPQHVW
ncbi:secretion protein EspG [Mycobacterium sp. ST-F2]|nr:secretion protein EspG [Mycobacterium sp. ST-F2]